MGPRMTVLAKPSQISPAEQPFKESTAVYLDNRLKHKYTVWIKHSVVVHQRR
jgi:hypothetical protein